MEEQTKTNKRQTKTDKVHLVHFTPEAKPHMLVHVNHDLFNFPPGCSQVNYSFILFLLVFLGQQRNIGILTIPTGSSKRYSNVIFRFSEITKVI